MHEKLLNFEQFLSSEIQLNYKNSFGRKFQLGNQLTLGSMAQATLVYSKIHIIITQHWLFVVSPSIQRTQIIVILHIMEQLMEGQFCQVCHHQASSRVRNMGVEAESAFHSLFHITEGAGCSFWLPMSLAEQGARKGIYNPSLQ